MSDNASRPHGPLAWFVALVLLALVAYQVYSGFFLRKIGIPGLFEIEFAQDTTERDSTSSAEQKLKAYLERCSSGDAEACNSAGAMIGDGDGAPIDFTQSAALYQQACELGSGRGCRNAARRYKLGRGVPQHFAKAASFYDRSCNLSYAKGCYELAVLYRSGKATPEPADRPAVLLQRACALGYSEACL